MHNPTREQVALEAHRVLDALDPLSQSLTEATRALLALTAQLERARPLLTERMPDADYSQALGAVALIAGLTSQLDTMVAKSCDSARAVLEACAGEVTQ